MHKKYVHLILRAHAGEFENRPEPFMQVVYYIDRDFVDTYGLKMVAGAPIKMEVSETGNTEYLISERTVTEANYASPQEALGKEVAFANRYKGFVSGVDASLSCVNSARALST